MRLLATPDMEEGAESSFFRLVLPQAPQLGESECVATRSSVVCPQS